jgi:homogentisate 1,2-dioxygenase
VQTILTTTKQDGETDTSPKSFLAHYQLHRTTLKRPDLGSTLKASHTQHSRLHAHITTAPTCTAADQQLPTVCTAMHCSTPVLNNSGGYIPIESKSNIENCFLSINPKIDTLPEQAEWRPFPLPKDDEKIDFADGLHTLCGSGDPNIREGLAVYVYMINSSMDRRAFCNTDGDFLICAQLGNLDIKTEMGKIFLQPGEICVIQRGIRFCLNLAPDTPVARGYITEVWGSMWELPDLGPLGGHGLANPRDFLYPVAAIDDDLHVDWQIVNKSNGQLVAIQQDHSPFDLVAWHGNVVPYKYDLTKFSSQNSTSIDHTDPSIFTVLTAKSRDPNTPLADFLWFGPRWDVATNTFRLPYFHRNSASEFLACLYGQGLGRSDDFQPGGGSFEGGHTPHGGFHEGYQHGMRIHESQPEKILTGMYSRRNV